MALSTSAPAFPSLASTVAPAPSALWGVNFTAPFPTNSPWQNFVLGDGTVPELVSPYLVSCRNGSIAFGFPSQTVSSTSIIQAFVTDLILTTLEGLGARQVAAYDPMSVTMQWKGGMRVPLVRGCPYLTFVLTSATPNFTTPHAVTSFQPNAGGTKHRISFNNGQTWLIYSSAPLMLTPLLLASAPFTGVIRVAILPPTSPPQTGAESVLDTYSSVYPTGGSSSVGNFSLQYSWQSLSWSSLAPSDLLMLTMPVHRTGLVHHPPPSTLTTVTLLEGGDRGGLSSEPFQVSLFYLTLDGYALGEVGTQWTVQLPPVNIRWQAEKGISPQGLAAVRTAVQADVASLSPVTDTSTYFSAKQLARVARIVLIAQEVNLTGAAQTASTFLEASLSPWFDGTVRGNALKYDSKWGGVVSSAGALNSGADFGNGLYNDHHFHYGYFLYAAAVMAKVNATWRNTYKAKVYSLVRDIFAAENDTSFTHMRHFDHFAAHSWASGLFVFGDGRNQESTSEAVNAYYAISLVGMAYGDLDLASRGATVATFESQVAHLMWHVPSQKNVPAYGAAFVQANRIVGVFWANKREAGLWFAAAEAHTIRLGIQVLPVTPFTERMFPSVAYAKELVKWALESPVGTTDEWDGFMWALAALYDVPTAVAKINGLTAYDNGNSKANLLYWVYTR